MRPLRAAIALAAGLICLGLAPRARAVSLVEKDEHTLDLDGAIKAFVFALHLPFHPPEIVSGMAMGEDRGGLGIGDVRLKLEGAHQERWKWELHFRSQVLLSSFPNAMGALGTGSGARPPRSLPLQATRPHDRTFQWVNELDRVNLRLRVGKVDIIVGRQPISLGAGFVWMPADLVGTFSPLEVDQEYKPGVDALRVNIALGQFSELSLIAAAGGPLCLDGKLPSGRTCHDYSAQFSLHHSVALARIRTTLGQWALGLLSGWVRGDVVVGAFVTGAFKRFRLRTEAVFTYDLEVDEGWVGAGNPTHRDDAFLRANVGLDYQFNTKKPLFVLGEIYYNGYGRRHARDYLSLARSPRVAELGEVMNLGLVYAAAGVSWEPHVKVPVSLTLMANLLDPSMHVSATATYKVSDESALVAGAMIPVGRAPRFDLYTPGFVALRSEFGLYPFVYYVMWKMYF